MSAEYEECKAPHCDYPPSWLMGLREARHLRCAVLRSELPPPPSDRSNRQHRLPDRAGPRVPSQGVADDRLRIRARARHPACDHRARPVFEPPGPAGLGRNFKDELIFLPEVWERRFPNLKFWRDHDKLSILLNLTLLQMWALGRDLLTEELFGVSFGRLLCHFSYWAAYLGKAMVKWKGILWTVSVRLRG
jgi:hypothetical protein